jgi:hypothetical protein
LPSVFAWAGLGEGFEERLRAVARLPRSGHPFRVGEPAGPGEEICVTGSAEGAATDTGGSRRNAGYGAVAAGDAYAGITKELV